MILSLIFVVIFSGLAISMASVSGTHAQVADNLRKANRARAAAESGLEICRLWLGNISISGDTPENLRFYEVVASLRGHVSANSSVEMEYAGGQAVIPSITLDTGKNCSFSATIHPIDSDILQLNVTGRCCSFTRTISVNYAFGRTANSLFDFGVATKGPLSLSGNIDLEGAETPLDASIYIESENSNLALSITGNSQIAGDVQIANSMASVDIQGGKAGIGGETGDEAIENHVEFGVPPTDFPEPSIGQFESFIVNTIDAGTNTSADAVFENARVLANVNPNFSGQVTLRGVILIETPNVVTFNGTTDVIGVIVGNGEEADDSGTNRLVFAGNVTSQPLSALPDEAQFAGLRDLTGTFLIAPGFHVTFTGNFTTLNGVIAASGVEFGGNAGGTINGSIINYSPEEMVLGGNNNLTFNPLDTGDPPSGFVPDFTLSYVPDSYSEM